MNTKGGVQVSWAVAMFLTLSCASSPRRVEKPKPTIVVLEAGAEPRQRVRYEPAPGFVEEVETNSKVRMANTFTNTVLETGKRDADFPTLIIRGRLQVTGRSPEGDALVSYTVENVQNQNDVVDARMRQVADAQARNMEGAHLSARLSPTGELADVKIEMPNAPSALRKGVSAMGDALDEMFTHFPEADIGVGAIWQVETRSTISGVTWTRKATYTLRDLTDGQAAVDVSVSMRASPQDLHVEPNASTTLTSGEGTMSGQALVLRHGLVATASSQMTTEANLLVVRQHLRISSTLRTEVTLTVKRVDVASEPSSAVDHSGPRGEFLGRVFAALDAHDATAMDDLGDPEREWLATLECTARKSDFDAERAKYQSLVARTKDVRLDLAAVDEDTTLLDMPEGHDDGFGCRTKVAMRFHRLVLRVRSTSSNGDSRLGTWTLQVVEHDGAWYLTSDVGRLEL